jgi:hypothetical protein
VAQFDKTRLCIQYLIMTIIRVTNDKLSHFQFCLLNQIYKSDSSFMIHNLFRNRLKFYSIFNEIGGIILSTTGFVFQTGITYFMLL